MQYFTKENITFLLALIGSIGSVTGWFYTYVVNKKKISIRIIAYTVKSNIILSYLSFENLSRSPISLTSISIKVNGVFYPCRHIPQKVKSTEHMIGGKIVSTHDVFNISLPIELGGLGATSGYILFVLPKDAGTPDAKTVTFQISSNRGAAVEMSLSLEQLLETF